MLPSGGDKCDVLVAPSNSTWTYHSCRVWLYSDETKTQREKSEMENNIMWILLLRIIIEEACRICCCAQKERDVCWLLQPPTVTGTWTFRWAITCERVALADLPLLTHTKILLSSNITCWLLWNHVTTMVILCEITMPITERFITKTKTETSTGRYYKDV